MPEAAKPPVEADGLTLRLNESGVMITMVRPGWKGGVGGGNGQFVIDFTRENPLGVLKMRSLTQANTTAKVLIEQIFATGLNGRSQKIDAVIESGRGRWSFAFDFAMSDGSPGKGRFSVESLLDRPDQYLLTLVLAKVEDFDAALLEIDLVLDNVKPLPT